MRSFREYTLVTFDHPSVLQPATRNILSGRQCSVYALCAAGIKIAKYLLFIKSFLKVFLSSVYSSN